LDRQINIAGGLAVSIRGQPAESDQNEYQGKARIVLFKEVFLKKA
jgi:hypothetical protein